jgi:beta-lactamase regulating signal transducer with metallopeptidase domain
MILDSIFPVLLNQLVQVSCVGVLAVLVTQWARGTRPHLVHAVWLIVFLKCITPPIVSSPTSPFSWLQAALVDSEDNRSMNTFYVFNRDSDNRSGELPSQSPVVATVSPSEHGGNSGERQSFEWISVWQRLSRSASSLSSIQLLMLSWLLIAGAIFVIFGFRFLTFLRWVNRTKLSGQKCGEYSSRLGSLVTRIEAKLGMRHRTRVEVVDALIGPAIVGIFRPTILLPKVIVDRIPDKQLETLIAHELVHFRRGDLWWSALQTLAVCCYWFHPLVWLARSVMNREAEKCCDEETIGSLKCEPGEYARCLISVLECKHLLRAAPLLPGVRPVDITAKRLERIMRLRQGCYRQCPRWVRITLIVGAIILLPGATLTLAQQGGKSASTPQIAPPAKTDNSIRLPQATPGLLPILTGEEIKSSSSNDQAVEKEDYQPESIDITDVLIKLQEAESFSPEQAEAKLLAKLPSPKSRGEAMVEIDVPNTPVKLGGQHSCIKVVGNRLFVLGTENERSSIRNYLEHCRYFGNQYLEYEIRIIDVPTKSLDAIAIRWDSEQTGEKKGEPNELIKNDVVPASFESIRVVSTSKMGQLDSTQINDLLACDGCQILAAPKLATFNAQSAQVRVGSEHPFVVGHTAVKGEDGKPTGTFQPKIDLVEAGIKLELESRVIENDTSKLAVKLKFTQTKIFDVTTSTFEQNGQEHTVQQPCTKRQFIETQFEQKLGATVALLGEPEMVDTVTERPVPILGKIPYVSRIFKNVAKHSELRTQVVLVTCRLVDGAEQSGATQSSEADPEIFDSPAGDPKGEWRPISK